MAKWAVVVSAEMYESERLYGADTLTLPPAVRVGAVFAPGDEALLIAATDTPVIFGLSRADAAGTLHYTVNLLDNPLPAGSLPEGAISATEGAYRLDDSLYSAVAREATPPTVPDRRTWLVSVDMPIEATTPAEAVRAFWNYVRELGPSELPAFVWPAGNELAMQAFVLGAESNQDPEED
jgi:hypothetical protein